MIAEVMLLQQIEQSLDKIVELAEKCITETGAATSDLEESQLRNFQNLAAATDSVPVLENFLGYQIGRKKIPGAIGLRVLDDIKKLSRMAEELTQRAPEACRRVRMELIRLYSGFLVRRFVAEKKAKEGKS